MKGITFSSFSKMTKAKKNNNGLKYTKDTFTTNTKTRRY